MPLSPLLRGTGLDEPRERLGCPDPDHERGDGAGDRPLRADLHGIPADGFVLVDGEAPGYRGYRELAGAAGSEPPAAVIDRDDPFNIIYSCGTTGLPKGIVHTHAIREAYCTGFASTFRIHPESVVTPRRLARLQRRVRHADACLLPRLHVRADAAVRPRSPDRRSSSASG